MDFHMIVLRKSFYIHWSAGRSPRVHEVNPGRDLSVSILLRWLVLVNYDYESCVDDKKSTSIYIFMMDKCVILCKSVTLTLRASSTMEAEYVVCYEATYHTIWLRNFIYALEVV